MIHATPILVFALAAAQPVAVREDPKPPVQIEGQWSEPPGPITPEERALLTSAEQALDHDGVSATLTDHRFDALHPRTEFREAVKARASAAPLSIAAPDEPGERLIVECVVKDQSGAPVPGALVYLYHTSAKGWYAADGAHVRADSGDHKHARLFGYARTDAAGRLELRTIRPGGYPRSTLPQHVHAVVEADGYDSVITELLFDDDPRLNAEQRTRAASEGFVIGKPTREADGVWRASYALQTRKKQAR